jgi:hypothetical protein
VEDEENVNMEQSWKQAIRGENRNTLRSACPNSTFATANQKLIGF